MSEVPVDLDGGARRIHVVGVGGAGMSAIATVLAEMGHQVTGSDLKESRGLDRLRALGVEVEIGHRPENVGDVDLVAISSAVPNHNPEVVAAHGRGIPVLRRRDLLPAILRRARRPVAVAGTHGKTTTSSMLAVVLMEAGVRPSFIIGGEVNEIGTGAAWDGEDVFVVEADESDGSFLALNDGGVLVTSVEPDHIEHYGEVQALYEAFDAFVGGSPGPRVVCLDDTGSAALAQAHDTTTYGTTAGADYLIEAVTTGRTTSRFVLRHQGQVVAEVDLAAPGLHNVRNAAGAATMALALGAEPAAVMAGLARYGGVARRFEFRGEAGGITFVDDYAHLPTEVRAALAAARSGGWSRIVCVFQPHRYSRTQALGTQFCDAFGDADLLVVTDIYGSGEQPRPGVTGRVVLDAVLDAHPHREVAWIPSLADVVDYLAVRLQPGDLCLTLGAGDLTGVPDLVLDRLRRVA